MPQENQYWLQKYTFSRRMVDHRYPYDFFHAINKPPLSADNIFALRNYVIGGTINKLAFLISVASLGFLFYATERYVYREGFTDIPVLKESRHISQVYTESLNSAATNPGKWNNNFKCWQNDPYCARDF